jgi:hypothetical protein
MSPDYPSFKDLYELQERVDDKLEKQTSRLTRMERGLIVLAVLVASPKLGGPDAASLVSAVIQHVV